MTRGDRTGMGLWRGGPVAGLVAQFVVLAAVAVSVGLSPLGWLTGAGYGLLTWMLLGQAMHRSGMPRLGWANQVTLTRAVLVGAVAALVVTSLDRPAPAAVLLPIAAVALLLDGVDGQVARRTGTTSALGARFDMEVDAFLILVLSVFVAQSVGGWAILIGAFRYGFVAAAWVLPWLRGALPPRLSRKAVAALQGILLVVASAGLLSQPLTLAVVASALALLTWSFGRDIGLLWRARHRQPATVAVAEPSLARTDLRRPRVPSPV